MVRFFHGFATAIYGTVAMAVVVQAAGNAGARCYPGFLPSPSWAISRAPQGGFSVRIAGAAPRLSHFHLIYGVVAILGLASFLLALWVLRRQTREPGSPPVADPGRSPGPVKTGVREISWIAGFYHQQ